MAGEGSVEVGTLPATPVAAGDVVRIPADMPQRITNVGNGELLFYAICSPRFRTACYVALE